MDRHAAKRIFLGLSIILPIVLLFVVRSFYAQPSYILSSVYKITFALPIVYWIFFYGKSWKEKVKENFSAQNFRKQWKPAVIWGCLVAAFYIGGYVIGTQVLDLKQVTTSLTQFASITPQNIIMIGIYIIVINSLLEEFFWRGFFFKETAQTVNRPVAYISNGVGFALYHLAFVYAFFPPIFVIIATTGLMVYAAIMCYLFEKYKDLFTLWLIHAIVDTAQIGIALKIFGII